MNGNRSLPERDQIVVELTLPNVEEREDLTHYRYFGDGSFAIVHRTREMIGKHVVRISNFSERDGEVSVKIDTGEKLLSAKSQAARQLAEELKLEILRGDDLSESDEKNSESPASSGSSDGQA